MKVASLRMSSFDFFKLPVVPSWEPGSTGCIEQRRVHMRSGQLGASGSVQLQSA